MTVETDWAAWTVSGERGRKTDSFKSDLLDRQDRLVRHLPACHLDGSPFGISQELIPALFQFGLA
jgi:hypothetical protein